MKCYYHYYLDSPLLVAAENPDAAAELLASTCGVEIDADDLRELPDCALEATIKQADGKRSDSLGIKLQQASVPGIIGNMPIDFSVVESSIRNESLIKMRNLNLILLGVPFSKIKLISESFRLDEHQRKFRKWINQTFHIYAFDAKDIKALHSHASTLQALLNIEVEKSSAIKAATSRIDQEYSERIEELQNQMGYI